MAHDAFSKSWSRAKTDALHHARALGLPPLPFAPRDEQATVPPSYPSSQTHPAARVARRNLSPNGPEELAFRDRAASQRRNVAMRPEAESPAPTAPMPRVDAPPAWQPRPEPVKTAPAPRPSQKAVVEALRPAVRGLAERKRQIDRQAEAFESSLAGIREALVEYSPRDLEELLMSCDSGERQVLLASLLSNRRK